MVWIEALQVLDRVDDMSSFPRGRYVGQIEGGAFSWSRWRDHERDLGLLSMTLLANLIDIV